MSSNARVSLPWSAIVGGGTALIALGAVGSYVAIRPEALSPRMEDHATTPVVHNQPATPPVATEVRGGDAAPLPDVVVPLTDEAVKRAGLVISTVQSGSMTVALRLPAVVEPNAYKQVSVTPLVAGRLTAVNAELGTEVRQGQTIATIFSPELAEAQTRYVAARAELEAHERELARTEKLVQIGAASRQELERIHAEHTAQRTSVDSLRSRLELLGLSQEGIDGLVSGRPVDATTNVPAPISGAVTERLANVGVNVDPSTKLFTVVDLSTVWIVANLYERDFSRVKVGDRVTVVTPAYPTMELRGRVGYIEPQVNPESRTARVRVELPNPRHDLRFGMLAEAQVEESAAASTLVPQAAVQRVAERSFVYLPRPDASSEFIEREVRLGSPSGDHVQVLSGLMPGDRVVTEGSFFLRAERERLGLRNAVQAAPMSHGESADQRSH